MAHNQFFQYDVNEDYLDRAINDFGATPIPAADVVAFDCDVLAPCALGNVINEHSIPTLKASVIAGAANNVLGCAEDGDALLERDILFAPDYVINAGGIIAVANEYLGNSDEDFIRSEIEKIADRLAQLFEASSSRGVATNRLADELARSVIEGGASARKSADA